MNSQPNGYHIVHFKPEEIEWKSIDTLHDDLVVVLKYKAVGPCGQWYFLGLKIAGELMVSDYYIDSVEKHPLILRCSGDASLYTWTDQFVLDISKPEVK